MVHPAAIHPLTPGSPAYAMLKVGAIGGIVALRFALTRRNRGQDDAGAGPGPRRRRAPAEHPVSRKKKKRRRRIGAQRFGCQSAISPAAGVATTLRQPAGPSRGSSSTVAPDARARVGGRGDLRDLDVGQPERPVGGALDDAPAEPSAQLQREVGASARGDAAPPASRTAPRRSRGRAEGRRCAARGEPRASSAYSTRRRTETHRRPMSPGNSAGLM